MKPQQAIKPDYGIDAPGVIRLLILLGAACLLVFASLEHTGRGNLQIPVGGSNVNIGIGGFLLITGIICLVEAPLMLIYSKWGKFRHRDRMLALHQWRGDERVLDVGTGRGLMMIGGAKRLAAAGIGRSVGIDIWRNQDLSGNDAKATLRNAELEGVGDRCEILSMTAQKLTFPDSSFDVVVSNLCLHNMDAAADRICACREIVRVLKSGGIAIISDFKKTGEYAKVFRESGCVVTVMNRSYFSTFPPIRIIVAQK